MNLLFITWLGFATVTFGFIALASRWLDVFKANPKGLDIDLKLGVGHPVRPGNTEPLPVEPNVGQDGAPSLHLADTSAEQAFRAAPRGIRRLPPLEEVSADNSRIDIQTWTDLDDTEPVISL